MTVPAGKLVLDVSNNRPITAAELKQSGAVALIAKATEGTDFKDKTFAAHRKAAKAVGVPFGSYLFLHAKSGGNESAYYLAYAKPVKGDIQPIIDAEGAGLDGASMATMAARVDDCAKELEGHGYKPILYASSSFWLALHKERPELRRLRVWEAQYPGVLTKWFPRLASLRMRLQHGASVVLWQWSQTYQVGDKQFDASRLLASLDSLLI